MTSKDLLILTGYSKTQLGKIVVEETNRVIFDTPTKDDLICNPVEDHVLSTIEFIYKKDISLAKRYFNLQYIVINHLEKLRENILNYIDRGYCMSLEESKKLFTKLEDLCSIIKTQYREFANNEFSKKDLENGIMELSGTFNRFRKEYSDDRIKTLFIQDKAVIDTLKDSIRLTSSFIVKKISGMTNWVNKYFTIIYIVLMVLFNFKTNIPFCFPANIKQGFDFIILLSASICTTIAKQGAILEGWITMAKNSIIEIITKYMSRLFPETELVKENTSLKIARNLLNYTFITFSVNLLAKIINIVCKLIVYTFALKNDKSYFLMKISSLKEQININNIGQSIIRNINYEKERIIKFFSSVYNDLYIEGIFSTIYNAGYKILISPPTETVPLELVPVKTYIENINSSQIEEQIDTSFTLNEDRVKKKFGMVWKAVKEINQGISGSYVVAYILLMLFFSQVIAVGRGTFNHARCWLNRN